MNVALYETPPLGDVGVVGAGLLAAVDVEETTFAGAEEEGKPGFFCGPSLSMPSLPDSVDNPEGSWDTEAVGGVTSPVP